MLNLHEEIQFRDAVRARPEIEHLEKLPLPALRVVRALLPLLPNPDDSVHFLNRLMEEAPAHAHRFWQDATALRYALTIFSYSHSLSDAVIRYPEWLLEIAAARDLHRGFLPEEYEERLMAPCRPTGCRVRSIWRCSAAAKSCASYCAMFCVSPMFRRRPKICRTWRMRFST